MCVGIIVQNAFLLNSRTVYLRNSPFHLTLKSTSLYSFYLHLDNHATNILCVCILFLRSFLMKLFTDYDSSLMFLVLIITSHF